MYHIWQYAFFILHDLAAMTCMTAVLATTRGYRERSRKRTVGLYAAACALSAGNIALLSPVVARTDFDTGWLIFGVVSLAPILVFPQIILRASRRWSSALLCLALNIGMEGLFSVVGYLLDDADWFAYHFRETIFCTAGYALVTAFLLYASKRRDLKVIRSTVELIPKWLYVVIMICSFSSFFGNIGQAPGVYSFEKVAAVFRMLAVFGIILFCGYFVFRVFALMAKQNEILLQMNVQQQNYERVLRSDEQLRQFRHDFRNHLVVVTSLMSAGQMDEAAAYLEKVKGSSGIADRGVSTGNFVADAILNNKKQTADAAGIDLTFTGVIPSVGVANDDLCTVLGNLVDNAIEGAARCPDGRYVKVSGIVRDGHLTLTVVNPVAGKVRIRGNRIRTTKGEPGHGIGLRNIASVAKQYQGGMLLACDEKEFTADVTLRLTEI